MLFFIFLCFTIIIQSNPQITSVGKWADFFPFSSIKQIIPFQNHIIGVSSHGLLVINLQEDSAYKITKVNGLSDVNISKVIKVDESRVIIGYESGQLDILNILNGEIISIPYLKDSKTPNKKKINDIVKVGDSIIIGTEGAIVVFYLPSLSFKSVLYPFQGKEVAINLVEILEDTIFCATDSGLIKAHFKDIDYPQKWILQPNNVYPPYLKFSKANNMLFLIKKGETWGKDTAFVYNNGTWNIFMPLLETPIKDIAKSDYWYIVRYYSVEVFSNSWNFLASIWQYKNENKEEISPEPLTIYPISIDSIWIGDFLHGLIKVIKIWNTTIYNFGGTLYKDPFKIFTKDSSVYFAGGGFSLSISPLWREAHFYKYEHNEWTYWEYWRTPFLRNNNIRDIVAIFPWQNNKFLAILSMSSGLILLDENNNSIMYNNQNSPLEVYTNTSIHGTHAMDIDSKENIWITNNPSLSLFKVLTPSLNWISINPGITTPFAPVSCIKITKENIIYVGSYKGGLLIYDPGTSLTNTNDDKIKILTYAETNGLMPSNSIYAIAQDKKGAIWIGTDAGIAIISSADAPFSQNQFITKPIIKINGYNQYLMEGNLVKSIAVDGQNNKWIGTDGGGLFKVSEDGTSLLDNFTTENSPLPSNSILDISIIKPTGEVVISTTQGVVIYRDTTAWEFDDFSNLIVFPNPVFPNYSGFIVISGLMDGSIVHILNPDGTVVNSFYSIGGEIVWNKKNKYGEKVGSGIYIIIAVHPTQRKKGMTKVLIL